MLILLLACVENDTPEDRGSPRTLCDCEEADPPIPQPPVFLVRIEAGVRATASEGEAWAGGGFDLEAVGDLDGDGLLDVWSDSVDGPVWRTSDPRGVRFAHFEILGAVLGDIDGDGLAEATLDEDPGLWILPGSVLAEGTFAESELWPVDEDGPRPAPAPDVDRDGLADTVWLAGRRIRMVLGANVDGAVGLASSTVDGSVTGDLYASGTGSAGDVDGDGIDDLAVVELDPIAHGDQTGRLSFWSGAGLAEGRLELLGEVLGDGTYGRDFRVVPLGDVDADGRGDLAIGWYPMYGPEAGSVSSARIVSGRELGTATPLSALGRPIPHTAGSTPISGRDVDGDGKTELVVHVDGTGMVFAGEDLGELLPEPRWTWSGGSEAVLAGLDPEGRLVVWVTDPDVW